MKNIAVVLAHPDDAEIVCFGTMRYYLDKGYNIFLIIVTNGENDINKTKFTIRQKETKNSFKNFKNFKIIFESENDGKLLLDYNLISKIGKKLMEIQPEIVITHFSDEILSEEHQDHIIVGNAVLKCCKKINSINQILLTEPVFANSRFTPNFFVDISKYFNEKLLALKKHKSQKNKYYMKIEFHKIKAINNALRANIDISQKNRYLESFFCKYHFLE